MTSVPPITARLAEFAATSHGVYLDAASREAVELLVADYIGVALRGSLTSGAQIVASTVASDDPGLPCCVMGSPLRAQAPAAALANAVAAHSIELDDVDRLALFHFSPPVVSAALAVGETTGASGDDLVAAVIIGCEVMARLSDAMNPHLRDRGFHTTPVCGIFGATAAAANLLHASPAQAASAFGLAGAQAGGLMQMYGPSMQKRFNPGPAARDGVLSALLAIGGFEGADDILEGDRGVIRAFTGRTPDAACLDGLGDASRIDIEFKAYACARPIHNAIDAGLAVRAAMAQSLGRTDIVDEIDTIELRRHPDWADYHLIPEPRTYHEAQVSVNYGAALSLARGAAFFDDYLETIGTDERVADLARRVTVEADSSLRRGVSCTLAVTTTAGAVFAETVDFPKGSQESPMGRDGLERKFLALAGHGLGDRAVSAWTVASDVANWKSVPHAMAAFR